jgi:hypothetical protein
MLFGGLPTLNPFPYSIVFFSLWMINSSNSLVFFSVIPRQIQIPFSDKAPINFPGGEFYNVFDPGLYYSVFLVVLKCKDRRDMT